MVNNEMTQVQARKELKIGPGLSNAEWFFIAAEILENHTRKGRKVCIVWSACRNISVKYYIAGPLGALGASAFESL